MAEIEGLYTALLRARDADRRDRVLAELARAGRRLAGIAAGPQPRRVDAMPLPPRLRQRGAAVTRGVEWILARLGD